MTVQERTMDASCDHIAPGSPGPEPTSQCVSPSTSSANATRSSRRSVSRRKPQLRGTSASSSEGATETVKTDLSKLLQLGDTLGAGAGTGTRTLPPDALDTVTSLVAGLPEEVVPLIIARSTARRGKGGRQPGIDPHLDPNVDPRRAKRILANRQSAARSKLKQKVMAETLRVQQQLAAKRAAQAEAELGTLKRKVVALEAENQQLEAAAAALLSFAGASSPGDASGAAAAGEAAAGDAAAAAAAGGGEGSMSTSEGSCAAPCQAPRVRRTRRAPRAHVKVEPPEVVVPDHPMSDAATHTCHSARAVTLAAQGLPPPAFAQGLAPFLGDAAGAERAAGAGAGAGQGLAERLPGLPASPRITTGAPGSPKLPGSPVQLPYGAAAMPASTGLLQLSPPQPPPAPLHRLDSFWSSGSTFDAGVLSGDESGGRIVKSEPAALAQGGPATGRNAAEAAPTVAAAEAYASLAAAAEAAATAGNAPQTAAGMPMAAQAPRALPSSSPFNHGAWHNLTLPSLSVGMAGPPPVTAGAAVGGGMPLLGTDHLGVDEDVEERCLVDIPWGLRSPPGSLPMVWGCNGAGGGPSASSGLFGEADGQY